ncbi:MAG: diphthamide synthesis protein [Candidatus Woesearchaeota archaeon]
MKIHYILPQKKINLENLDKEFRKIDSKELTIVYSIQFKETAEELKKILNKQFKDIKSVHSKNTNQILGCDFIKFETDILAVVENRFHLLPIVHSSLISEKILFVLDLATEKILKITFEKFELDETIKKLSPGFFSKFYMKIFDKNTKEEVINIDLKELNDYSINEISKFYHYYSSSKYIGFIISTKRGQYNIKLYHLIKEELKDKKIIPIVFDNVEKLENFSSIKFFINSSCPRIVEDYNNIINATDFLILKKYIFDSSYKEHQNS